MYDYGDIAQKEIDKAAEEHLTARGRKWKRRGGHLKQPVYISENNVVRIVNSAIDLDHPHMVHKRHMIENQ